MSLYVLTVSLSALGLPVVADNVVVIAKKRILVSDAFPPIINLYKVKSLTNVSGIATASLDPDDATVYHEVEIYDLLGVKIYTRVFTMPPQAVALTALPVPDIITESAAAAVSAAITATEQAVISTEQAVIATEQAVLTAADVIATAADRVQTGLDVIDTAAAAAGTVIRKFATYTEQMAYTGAYVDGQKADVLGYFSVGDGGAIPMYWSASSTATHNGGTVRKPTSVSGAGRWLAVNPYVVNVAQFGAFGSGDDYNCIQNALTAVGEFGMVGFAKTSTGVYLVSQELKFYEGQRIFAYGGTSITGAGCEIRLTALANGVMSPDTPETTKYSGTIKNIYFNAQSYGDYGLSLYNCSYLNIVSCAANTSKAGGCGLLLDSNDTLQCYFNTIRTGRFFATGTGSTAIRFTRGANANTIIGGKCGSSATGIQFLSSSSGNIINGMDFEENTVCHIYADAPSNIFQSLHMESCPIGFWLTSLANNTARIGTSYASTVIEQVRDYSKTGSVLDTRVGSISTEGDLRFGAAKFTSNLLDSITTVDFDPDIVSSISSAIAFRMFLHTTTLEACRILLYRGDGTTNLGISLNARTGEVQHGDLVQENGASGGVLRKIIHRAVAPSTGTWSTGDKCYFTSPVKGGYIGAVYIGGVWENFGLIP